jgi:hypothetical protein
MRGRFDTLEARSVPAGLRQFSMQQHHRTCGEANILEPNPVYWKPMGQWNNHH